MSEQCNQTCEQTSKWPSTTRFWAILNHNALSSPFYRKCNCMSLPQTTTESAHPKRQARYVFNSPQLILSPIPFPTLPYPFFSFLPSATLHPLLLLILFSFCYYDSIPCIQIIPLIVLRNQKVQLHVTVVDYDRIGTSEPIGKVRSAFLHSFHSKFVTATIKKLHFVILSWLDPRMLH